MSRIRGRDTKPEIQVRRALHAKGYRFRLHRRDLPGRPDIFLPKHKLAIFVNGCFWHGHEGCKRAKLPETRREFWESKIATNKQRDIAAIADLQTLGIVAVTLWECEIKSNDAIVDRIDTITGREYGTHGEKIEATRAGSTASKPDRTSGQF